MQQMLEEPQHTQPWSVYQVRDNRPTDRSTDGFDSDMYMRDRNSEAGAQ
jgi:hypothetical protein